MRILFTIFFCLLVAETRAQNSGRWYKGNTHTHSFWSDGDDYPEMIMEWYKSHGYDFISLSDHNILAQGEKWKLIPASPLYQRRFEEYLKKYGRDWVIYKTDTSGLSVKLKTLKEYRPLFEEKGKFLIIQAEEISDRYKEKLVHVGAVNIKYMVKPQGGNSVAEVMQNDLNEVYAQRKRTGLPMLSHINHPNFLWSVKIEDMLELKGNRFFEVYNGHPHVNNPGDSATIGMEELWDRLLIHYIKEGKLPLYGLATDDSHDYLDYKTENNNRGRDWTVARPGRGWIVVRAKELTPEALIESMEKGDFYASTGVELENVTFKNRTLKIRVKPEEGTDFTIQFWGAGKSATEEKKMRTMLKEVKGTRAKYKLRNKDIYVRAKVISSRLQENHFRDQKDDYKTAWTQPVLRRKIAQKLSENRF